MSRTGARARLVDFLSELEARRGIQLGLDRVRLCCSRLGHPEQRFLSVGVAGTKGKGSTAAILQNILCTAGRRAGLYTSPHLVSFRERFLVGAETPSWEELEEQHERIGAVTGWGSDPPLTVFEWLTMMSFLLFASHGVEVAVLEAGMGGRLDATAAARPPVVLFGIIGRDHERHLGCSVESIAREKAGLLFPGALAATQPQVPAAERVLAQAARSRGARLFSLGTDARVRVHGTDQSGVVFDFDGPGRRLGSLFCPLPGRHQALNASLAILGALLLEEHGIRVGDPALRTGVATVRWPGRLETLGERPTVILDGAHNVDSFEALVAFLSETFPERRPQVVMGVLEDKDLEGMMRVLRRCRPRVWAVPCPSPRSVPEGVVAASASRAGIEVAGVCGSVEEALDAARSRGDDPVVVTGSFFVVGPARRLLTGAVLPDRPGCDT